MITIAWALQLLQAVPQVVAAAPNFKRLWDELVHTFHGNPAQQDLKDAYAAAISDAADANADLQEIIARHTS
jgi:ABC-type transporter Mla subunit MlaD